MQILARALWVGIFLAIFSSSSAFAQDPTATPTCTPTGETQPTATPTPTLETQPTATPTPTLETQPTNTPTPTPTTEVIPTVTPTPTPTPSGQAGCILDAVPSELWPPNHKFVNVRFFDESGLPVTPLVTSVFQDEPTKVRGSGNFCPDARILQDGSVQVRSERTGNRNIPGDGRVYHIGYVLTLGGIPCEGETLLCVPHDQRPGHACIDEGPVYDSLTCSFGASALKNTGAKHGSAEQKAGQNGHGGTGGASHNKNGKGGGKH